MKYLSLLIISIFLSSCQRSSEVSAVLSQVESIMQDKPEEALEQLRAIDSLSLPNRKVQAKYALLYSQALDKNYIDIANDSLIRIAVDYYTNHGSHTEKAKALYYYAIVQNNALNTDAVITSLIAAREYVEKSNADDLKGLIHSYLGNLYYEQYSFEEAITAYSQAVTAFSNIDNKPNLLLALYGKGLALNMLNKDQDAITVLSEAKSLAIEIGNKEMIMNIMTSIGGAKIADNQDIKLLQNYLYEIFYLYGKYTSGKIPSVHYPIIGYIYYQEGLIDSARLYYTRYYAQNPHITSANVGVLAMLSKIESHAKNYKSALEYEQRYADYSDSLNTVWKNNLVQNLDRKYQTEYLAKSYATLKRSYKYSILSLILAVVIIVIVFGTAIHSYRKAIHRKDRKIAEYKHYVEDGNILYTELLDKCNGLKKNTNLQDEHSQALFTLLGNRIQSLKQLLEWAAIYENNADNFYKHFKGHIKVATGKNKELTDDVIAIANLSCNHVIDRLHELHPSLSQYELCYCSFICLGFSSESVRILYNHTNSYSIYTMRSKIRNKMGITNNALYLETYILNVMKELE